MTKCIVLTGGSRGIGEATLNKFTQEGWKGVNISRTPCKIPGITNFSIDLSVPENIDKYIKPLKESVADAEVICLIHNAGYQTKDTVMDLTLEEVRHTLNVNVISSSMLNKIFIPLMKPGSAILYTGSMLADRGVPGNASYTLSKHAVLGLMRSTCQDLIGRSISTCCICPGLVNTRLLKESMSDELIQHLLDTYIVGKRLIDPTEIAKVMYDCAHSPVINGTLVATNLGLVAS